MDTHMKKIHAKCVDYEDDYQAEQKDEQVIINIAKENIDKPSMEL